MTFMTFRALVQDRPCRVLELAALVEDFDAPLGLLEPRVAEPRELHAAFEQLQRLLERDVAVLELLDDRVELRQRGFEILDRWIHKCLPGPPALASYSGGTRPTPRTSHSNSPRWRVTRTRSPASTVAASRMTCVRSASQQTA